MNCQICNKNRQWFVTVVRYPPDGSYDPVPFEWCISCAFKELKIAFDEEEEK